MSKLSIALAKNSDFNKDQIESFLTLLTSHVVDSLKSGEEVRIPDLVTFSFEDKGERIVRIPRTNDIRVKAPERLPKAKLSVGLKALIQPELSPAPDDVPPPLPNVFADAPADDPLFEKGIVGFVPPGQFPAPLPPLPIAPELTYFLADGSQVTKSEILAKNDPSLLVWHSTFGPNWKPVSVAFAA